MITGFEPTTIEQAALSCMMQYPDCYAEGIEKLIPDHFQDPSWRLIHREMVLQYERNIPFDLPLFTHHLGKKGLLGTVGGAVEVTSTYTTAHSPLVFRYYIDLLDEALAKRRFVKAAEEGIRNVEHNEETAIPDALTRLSEIGLQRTEGPTFLEAVADKINRMEFGEPESDIIKTGLIELDEHSPLRNGDMPLIAGERKAGKSVLSLSIATNVAKSGIPVLYFSLEDRMPKVIDRIFAGVSRVPMRLHHMRSLEKGDGKDMNRCIEASGTLGKLPLIVRDDVYDLHAIIAVIRRLKARQKAGLVIVDYAQLIRAKAESRREEVEKVSRDLRLTAMELNVPIILLCQLNKEGETRETKALEMDATAMWKIEMIDDKTQGERRICIPWQRNGESGHSFKVAFLGSLARVENMGRDCSVPERCG